LDACDCYGAAGSIEDCCYNCEDVNIRFKKKQMRMRTGYYHGANYNRKYLFFI
jgi:hypothetical protein